MISVSPSHISCGWIEFKDKIETQHRLICLPLKNKDDLLKILPME